MFYKEYWQPILVIALSEPSEILVYSDTDIEISELVLDMHVRGMYVCGCIVLCVYLAMGRLSV